jgi:hypothetical protein
MSACFSPAALEQLVIWLILAVAIIAIIRILVPWLLATVGVGGPLAQIVHIVLWVIAAILVIRAVFVLLTCIWR